MEFPVPQERERERSGLERLRALPAGDARGDEAAARSFRIQQPFRALGSRVERGEGADDAAEPRRA